MNEDAVHEWLDVSGKIFNSYNEVAEAIMAETDVDQKKIILLRVCWESLKMEERIRELLLEPHEQEELAQLAVERNARVQAFLESDPKGLVADLEYDALEDFLDRQRLAWMAAWHTVITAVVAESTLDDPEFAVEQIADAIIPILDINVGLREMLRSRGFALPEELTGGF